MTYRRITEKEREVFLRILSVDFHGKENLVAQLDELEIFPLDEVLYKLSVSGGESKNMKKKTFGLPVEAMYLDQDGVVVYVDLFVDENDILSELEIWKSDGSPVITQFTDAELSVRIIE